VIPPLSTRTSCSLLIAWVQEDDAMWYCLNIDVCEKTMNGREIYGPGTGPNVFCVDALAVLTLVR